MGMALDESIEGLEKLESDGLTAYIDPNLLEYVRQMGQIYIDTVDRPGQRTAYTIMIGDADGSCSSGSCGSGGCS